MVIGKYPNANIAGTGKLSYTNRFSGIGFAGNPEKNFCCYINASCSFLIMDILRGRFLFKISDTFP
jgi:hypothetical protein